MLIYLMWSVLVIAWTSRFATAWLGSQSPSMQGFRGLRMVSDPIVIIVVVSIGFGSMIAGVTAIDYRGVLLVMTLISLSICRVPSFLLRTYSISVAMLVGLISLADVPGKSVILLSAIIPFAGAPIIKGCQWVGEKIEW